MSTASLFAVVTFLQAAKEASIASEEVMENYEEQPLDFVLEDYAGFFPFDYDPGKQIDLAPYRSPVYERDQAMVEAWIAKCWVWPPSLSDQQSKAMAAELN
jgi:hypothetical protein